MKKYFVYIQGENSNQHHLKKNNIDKIKLFGNDDTKIILTDKNINHEINTTSFFNKRNIKDFMFYNKQIFLIISFFISCQIIFNIFYNFKINTLFSYVFNNM